jgi:hypothetical protein
MPTVPTCRTQYGANKYAALHLLLARWLRNHATASHYSYVTLGGTELKDCQSVYFIDPKMMGSAVSFETEQDRFDFAVASATSLAANGVAVTVQSGDIFEFQRSSDNPHLFFFDFEGICAFGDMYLKFSEMFLNGRLREQDTFFITSCLGRNPGWDKVFDEFDAQFRILRITDLEQKKLSYRRSHPSFTIYNALSHVNMQGDIQISCIGCVQYRDTSPMGVYGYVVRTGSTEFERFITDTPYYHANKGIEALK